MCIQTCTHAFTLIYTFTNITIHSHTILHTVNKCHKNNNIQQHRTNPKDFTHDYHKRWVLLSQERIRAHWDFIILGYYIQLRSLSVVALRSNRDDTWYSQTDILSFSVTFPVYLLANSDVVHFSVTHLYSCNFCRTTQQCTLKGAVSTCAETTECSRFLVQFSAFSSCGSEVWFIH